MQNVTYTAAFALSSVGRVEQNEPLEESATSGLNRIQFGFSETNFRTQTTPEFVSYLEFRNRRVRRSIHR